ncbi:toprim domain-containing protein [Candidatus Bathyarchaeota archaeon]|nr:toprim domain-containing protein [Candidatus Bathyarchaeota archaeon]RJS87858.1 MAG: toprim domain-containing protein [Candidatus Bathyarchaeota archaeon]
MNGYERRLEEILRLLEKLKERMADGALVIVEGRKDVESLRKLGAVGKILPAKSSGKSLLDALREIERQEVKEAILLMDFDRRGREWTMRLARHLEAMKIRPNLTFWRQLLGLARRDVKDIESLAGYIETLSEKIGKNILNGKQ